MRYLSVCSGIEAATVAWHPLGWQAAAFSEIEKFPRAVLKYHYPEVPCHGDFTTIGADEYGPIDLLVGGTPCQSFSIAGLRGGLADDRGNLALEYLRLAQRTRPEWLVWENVPGVLSSNGGRDFGSILGGMVELGYGIAYRVLDAQFFGVPQRRRRVFVVGCLGDWRRAAAVLFERHSLSGHSAPRREKGEAVAALTASGVGTCGADDNQGQAGHLIPQGFGGETAPTINAAFGSKLGLDNQHIDSGAGLFVAHSLRGEGFDASKDGTGRGTPLVPVAVAYGMATQQEPKWAEELCPTLQVPSKSGGGQPHCVAFTAKDYEADAMDDCSPTLRAGGFAGSHANGGVMPAVAFVGSREVAGALTANYGKQPDSSDTGLGPNLAVAFKIGAGSAAGSIGLQEECAPTLGAGESGTQRSPGLLTGCAVRRLTPRECERLQGFPEVQKCYTILVCRDLSDQQKANALAALQCRKLQSSAWTAGAGGWMLSAEAAADHSSISLAVPAPPVVLDVLIDLERQVVRLHSAGKSFSTASNAGERSEFPLPTGIDSFARLAALLTHAWALQTQVGKAASQANTIASTTHLNGSSIAVSFGREIDELAADAANAVRVATDLTTSTTLPSGLDTENLHSTLTTLSSCVVRAIAGFIPEKTRAANCYAVRLTTSQGYTAIPWRGKDAADCPDGPRYKALGNSMAVPVMRWIGERIQAVEAINDKRDAA